MHCLPACASIVCKSSIVCRSAGPPGPDGSPPAGVECARALLASCVPCGGRIQRVHGDTLRNVYRRVHVRRNGTGVWLVLLDGPLRAR